MTGLLLQWFDELRVPAVLVEGNTHKWPGMMRKAAMWVQCVRMDADLSVL